MYATASASVFDALPASLRQVADPYDLPFLAKTFASIPSGFHRTYADEYATRFNGEGRKSANLFAVDLQRYFPEGGAGYTANDDEVMDKAEQAAQAVRQRLSPAMSESEVRELLLRIAGRYGVALPKFPDLQHIISRMTAPLWWRGQLRKLYLSVEHAAIKTGLVHRHGSPYVSEPTFQRYRRHKRRNNLLLDSWEAVNEVGDTFTLAELSAHSVSNPAVRRAELMTRLSGIEEHAGLLGYVGLRITITTPSRMHAVLESGAQNPRYDLTRADGAQRYLCKKVWEPAEAKLARDDIDYCGARAVEPHHDGTPHWHLLIFVHPDQAEALTQTLRDYALRENPDEPGAQKHRFNVERIDPAKGSAAGYFAKYIAKNIDGEGVGQDYETSTPASDTAPRVVAWASLYRIRQFQFFGTPDITIWRELRRLKGIPAALEPVIGDLWRAADVGDYARWLDLMGHAPAGLRPWWVEGPSARYPGELTSRVRGLIVPTETGPVQLITHEHEWLIRERAGVREARNRWKTELRERALGLPWTRVNNSTGEAWSGSTGNDSLTWTAQEGQPADLGHDVGGLAFFRSRDGTVHVLRSPGYLVGGFRPVPEGGAGYTADDDEARGMAERAVREVRNHLPPAMPEPEVRGMLRRVADRYSVELPRARPAEAPPSAADYAIRDYLVASIGPAGAGSSVNGST